MKSCVRAGTVKVWYLLLAAVTTIGCTGTKEPTPAVASSSSTNGTSSMPAAPQPTRTDPGDAGSGGESATQSSEEGSSAMGSQGGDMSSMSGMNAESSAMGSGTGYESYGSSMGGMGSSEMGMGAGGMGTGDMGMGTGDMGMGSGGMGMYGMGGQAAVVDPAPTEDADYMTKAKYAFAIGKESAAEQYFIAHLLSNEEEAASLLSQVRWSPGARKLASTVRFAVGVDLKAPPNVADIRPIGQSVPGTNNPGGSGGEMGMMSMGSSGGGPASGGAQKTFGDLTGKFGEELMKSFETAWDSGSFGTVFKDIDTIEPLNRAANSGVNGMGSSMAGMGSMSSLSDESAYAMPGQTNGAPGTAGPDPTPRMRAVPGKVIVPGLLYLGTGSATELAAKCEAENIDYLFVFEVNVKAQRQRVQNDTRLRLIATKDGSSLGATSTLNNLEVDRELAMKGESDVVTKQLTGIFRKVEPLKLTDLPKLQPVHAQARIKSLIEKHSKDALQTLLEVRLFHSIGLLDNDERDAAYQLVLGGNGLALVGGPVEDREFVLGPLLPAYK